MTASANEKCGTCNDSRLVPEYGGDPSLLPCPACRRVVRVEDAAVSEAVREIERQGLQLARFLTPRFRNGKMNDDPTWEVGKIGGCLGDGPTLPAALSAYRRAAKEKR